MTVEIYPAIAPVVKNDGAAPGVTRARRQLCRTVISRPANLRPLP
jgi:hypothetical protein